MSEMQQTISRIQNAIDNLDIVLELAEQGQTDNAKTLCFSLFKDILSILGGVPEVTKKYDEFMKLWGRVYYSLYKRGEQK